MNPTAQSRFRAFAAWVCLLAVASLFAPLAGAAWSLNSMDCCNGDHCTVPKHHHRQAPVQADCDHENSSSLMNCSMSCCQDEERVFATAMNFVMPPAVADSAPADSVGAVQATRAIEIPRAVQPLIPPPRTTASL